MSKKENYSRDNHYQQKNYSNYLYSGFIGMLFRWQHKLLSPKIYVNCEKVLEIGPGFEPHIKFTKSLLHSYYTVATQHFFLTLHHQNEYNIFIILLITFTQLCKVVIAT